MKSKMNKNKGFTLLEMLVVIAIIGLISASLVASWRKNEKQYLLQRTAQEIVQNIRKAQDMALTSFRYEDGIPLNYGIYFTTWTESSYLIFADNIISDYIYTLAPWIDKKVGDSIVIDKDIEIDSLYSKNSPSSGMISRSRVYIAFSLPDTFTTIKTSFFSLHRYSAIIRIRKVNGTCPQDCKDIIVRNTGQINIE